MNKTNKQTNKQTEIYNNIYRYLQKLTVEGGSLRSPSCQSLGETLGLSGPLQCIGQHNPNPEWTDKILEKIRQGLIKRVRHHQKPPKEPQENKDAPGEVTMGSGHVGASHGLRVAPLPRGPGELSDVHVPASHERQNDPTIDDCSSGEKTAKSRKTKGVNPILQG